MAAGAGGSQEAEGNEKSPEVWDAPRIRHIGDELASYGRCPRGGVAMGTINQHHRRIQPEDDEAYGSDRECRGSDGPSVEKMGMEEMEGGEEADEREWQS
ncbi:hypothetical protein GW17_00038386 [Ensete ventricosum]|nr:hypothetical protein GW17_00038386 [Ensete ventricosum]